MKVSLAPCRIAAALPVRTEPMRRSFLFVSCPFRQPAGMRGYAPPPRRVRGQRARGLYARARGPSPGHRVRPGFALEFLRRGFLRPYRHAADRSGSRDRPHARRQLARDIEGRLRAGYVREPRVSVEIEAYRPFFVLGEVNTVGQFPYVNGMSVETAVAIAGGFTPRARKDPAPNSPAPRAGRTVTAATCR